MRASRIGLIGAVLAATAALVITALPAGAEATPTAPYDVITYSRLTDGAFYNSHDVVEPPDATFSAEPYGGGIKITAVTATRTWRVGIQPPSGDTLYAGVYQVLQNPAPGIAGFWVEGSQACNPDSGTVSISELTRDAGTQAITTLALTYTVTCMGSPATSGEVRWHSTMGYTARTIDSNTLNLGYVAIGDVSAPQTVTVTAKGSLPLVLGSATVSESTGATFPIQSDSCSGATLSYGQTCSLTLTANPTASGGYGALLTIPDNTSMGAQTVWLSVTAQSAYGVTIPSFLSFTSIAGVTAAAQTVTIQPAYAVGLKLQTATIIGANPTVFAIVEDTCSGKTLAQGQTCLVKINATPPAKGQYSAQLRIPDNSPVGYQQANLGALGLSRASAETGSALQFGSIPVGDSSPAQTVTITSTGLDPLNLGAAVISGSWPAAFAKTADTCSNTSLAPGESCTVSIVATPPGAQQYGAYLYIPDNTDASAQRVDVHVTGFAGAEGTFYPLAPTRIMDTRTGNGAPLGAVGPASEVSLQVASRGGVPASGVGAVVLNVTVTKPTTNGYVTVYPAGVSRPVASNLNFVAGWTGANSVTVAVGTDGKINLYNSSGYSHLIVDVMGFYASDNQVLDDLGLGGQFQAVVPLRLIDTRKLSGGRLAANETVLVGADFSDFGPNSSIRALAVNITAVKPDGGGYLTAWSGAGPVPLASTLNFTAGRIVPNFAIVPVMPCPDADVCGDAPIIAVYNGSGAGVDVLIDIVGAFDDSTLDGGLRFSPMTPTRIADTRQGFGAPAALGPGATTMFTAPVSVATANTYGLVTNLTAVKPTRDTYLTMWPNGLSRPTVSNLNPAAGQTVPNAAITLLNEYNQFLIFNQAGSTHVVVDVVGTFEPGLTASYSGLKAKPTFRVSAPRTSPLSVTALSLDGLAVGG